MDRSIRTNRGTIFCSWAESTNRIDSDVFVKSIPPPNGGRPEVSPPVKVNNDGPGADQFFPWLSVDANNGSVCVAFYDRRDDVGGIQLNMYLARSTDGGNSFAENPEQVQWGRIRAFKQTWLGAGTSTALGTTSAGGDAGEGPLLWADTRNRKQEIFYGRLEYASSGGGDPTSGKRRLCVGRFRNPPLSGGRRHAIGDWSCGRPVSFRAAGYAQRLVRSDPRSDTVYGVDTALSDYDTVVTLTCVQRSTVSPQR